MRQIFVLVAAAAFLAHAGPAVAAGKPGQGRAIAAERCAKCHAVPDIVTQGGMDIAPSFNDMASGFDIEREEWIRTFLGRPHWPMRQVTLSPSDIDNIVAYLQSLSR